MDGFTPRLQLLHELLSDDGQLEFIRRQLEDEWGPFAPADAREMQQMAERAGHHIYVLRLLDPAMDALSDPVAVLQTGLADLDGDPHRLVEQYPTFDHITAGGTWKESRHQKGNTALLLQITAFGARGAGAGSLLRDCVFRSLDESVRYALTTTPVDDNFDPADTSTPVGELYKRLESCGPGKSYSFPPAVKFHYFGGAEPAGYARCYKLPDPSRPNLYLGRQHHNHVVFMRYTRHTDGWPSRRGPEKHGNG